MRERLKEIRRVWGLGQNALAEAAGVPGPNVSRLGKGPPRPSLRDVLALARFSGVRPEWLAEGDGQPAEQPELPQPALEAIRQRGLSGTPPTVFGVDVARAYARRGGNLGVKGWTVLLQSAENIERLADLDAAGPSIERTPAHTTDAPTSTQRPVMTGKFKRLRKQ